MFLRLKPLGAAALLLIAQQAAATNGYFSEGYGTNSKAQAGVGIALPLDSLTIATNPAGLTEVADGITGGIEIFRPRRDATLVQGGQAEEFDGNDTRPFFTCPRLVLAAMPMSGWRGVSHSMAAVDSYQLSIQSLRTLRRAGRCGR
jgi:hypothetical protein